mmetsp:Transcript_96714/g.191745  ORF Transcript_96714/g.191745 Transcript_96714/m.191745 type:complete len:296 (-) Transcript_96714:7-894(-)
MCAQSSLPRLLITLALITLVASPVYAKRAESEMIKLQDSRRSSAATVSMVSANFGGRGFWKVMPQCPQGMKCVMYTNNPVKVANGWIVDPTPYHTNMQKTHPNLFTSGRHSYGQISKTMVKNNMEAKFYKMNSFLLPQATGVDIIFWCDADSISIACQAPHLADRIRDSLSGHAMTVKTHEVRTSVRAEMKPAADYIKQKRGYPDGMKDIKDAWAHMEKMGFKDDAGLFHCDQFIFDARSPVVQSLFHTWWHEVQDYTFRDQISFPFVLQHFNPSVRRIARTQNILDMPRLEPTE